jgi:hypothetical protein
MGSKDVVNFKTKSQSIVHSIYHPPSESCLLVTKTTLECYSTTDSKLIWEQELDFNFTCAVYHQDFQYIFAGNYLK